MTAHLGTELYERTERRTGQRNGYKLRQLPTWLGTLTLLVPQDRAGTFSTQLFARYQRTEKALVLSLMEMYLHGVSTRKVRAITATLCGTTFSKSLVSRLASTLDTFVAGQKNVVAFGWHRGRLCRLLPAPAGTMRGAYRRMSYRSNGLWQTTSGSLALRVAF